MSECLDPYGSFRKLGVPCFGILIIGVLLFRVLYSGPLFSETPIYGFLQSVEVVDAMSMSVSMEAAPVHATRDLLSTPATCAATSHAESGSPADAGHCPETPKPLN